MTSYWPQVSPALLAACAPALTGGSGLTDLLPAVEGMVVGETHQAEGNDLFRLIDGGAELYIEHGFQRAVTREYVGAGDVEFTLEIFEMKDAAGASAVYTHKAERWRASQRSATPAPSRSTTASTWPGASTSR